MMSVIRRRRSSAESKIIFTHLFNLSRTWCIADVVEAVKTSTSKWMKTQGREISPWQSGYGAFSVSRSNVERYTTTSETNANIIAVRISKVSFEDC